jgi:hypothetical protein
MENKDFKEAKAIEGVSCLWSKLFVKVGLPRDGVVVEVAPGYEPKIGNALALLGFQGTIYLIEPDKKAARHIRNMYQQILPQAKVGVVTKLLADVKIGIDIPSRVDTLAASHPFDDMVMASIISQSDFFSREKEDLSCASFSSENIYAALRAKDYMRGIKITTVAWQEFLQASKPKYFLASQYPSHTLKVRGLVKRQNAGFAVLWQLKRFYRHHSVKQSIERSFGFKGNPKWWILVKNPKTKN